MSPPVVHPASGVCLQTNHEYALEVTVGEEGGMRVKWRLCGHIGGAPFRGVFRV